MNPNDKEKLLGVYPNATFWRGYIGQKFIGVIISGESNGYPKIGIGISEQEALDDALNRLSVHLDLNK